LSWFYIRFVKNISFIFETRKRAINYNDSQSQKRTMIPITLRIKYILVIIILLQGSNIVANLGEDQNLENPKFNHFYFSPGINLGYCLTTGGFSWGLDLNLGYRNQPESLYGYGINLSKSWTVVKNSYQTHIHRHSIFNVFYESQHIEAKAGYGRLSNPWGYGKNNKCKTSGFNIDIAGSIGDKHLPMLGLRTFLYKRSSWRWADAPYLTLYSQYRYDSAGFREE